jgi:hypothetical protein
MKTLPFVLPLALLACLAGGFSQADSQPREEKAEVQQRIPVDSSREPIIII